MATPDKKKKVSDDELVRGKGDAYARAYSAAWFCVSENSKMLGAPTFKLLICHVAALRALGSERTIHRELAKASVGGDPNGLDMIRDAYDKACLAAKEKVNG